MVVHDHIAVNTRKINIPSYSLEAGDVMSLCSDSEGFIKYFDTQTVTSPYLRRHETARSATLERLPERHEIFVFLNDALIVEFYSKHH